MKSALFLLGLALGGTALTRPLHAQEETAALDSTPPPAPKQAVPPQQTPTTPPDTTAVPASDGNNPANLPAVSDILQKDREEVARILARSEAAIERRKEELLKALEIQMAAAQRAGDLDAFLELRSEIERVRRGIMLGEPQHQPTDPEGRRTFATLRQAREAFNTAVANANRDLEADLNRLNDKTAEELHKAMRELTRVGRIEEAVVARDTRNQIRQRKPSQIGSESPPVLELPKSGHSFSQEDLTQRLLKTTWRRTHLATNGVETIGFERGMTTRGQPWQVLPDGTLALTTPQRVEIWVFNRNLTEASGYLRGSDRVSFTAIRQ